MNVVGYGWARPGFSGLGSAAWVQMEVILRILANLSNLDGLTLDWEAWRTYNSKSARENLLVEGRLQLMRVT